MFFGCNGSSKEKRCRGITLERVEAIKILVALCSYWLTTQKTVTLHQEVQGFQCQSVRLWRSWPRGRKPKHNAPKKRGEIPWGKSFKIEMCIINFVVIILSLIHPKLQMFISGVNGMNSPESFQSFPKPSRTFANSQNPRTIQTFWNFPNMFRNCLKPGLKPLQTSTFRYQKPITWLKPSK